MNGMLCVAMYFCMISYGHCTSFVVRQRCDIVELPDCFVGAVTFCTTVLSVWAQTLRTCGLAARRCPMSMQVSHAHEIPAWPCVQLRKCWLAAHHVWTHTDDSWAQLMTICPAFPYLPSICTKMSWLTIPGGRFWGGRTTPMQQLRCVHQPLHAIPRCWPCLQV